MRSKIVLYIGFILLVCIDLFAAPESVAFFNDKPRSLAKDFYIFNYLQQDTTSPKEAKALFGMVHTMNLRFFHLFAKKMDNEEFKKISRCIDMDVNALLKEDDTCLNIGINLSKVSSLPKSQLASLEPRISRYHTQLRSVIKLMRSENVYESALHAHPETVMALLQGSITAYKKQNFPNALPTAVLNTLSSAQKFNAFVINVAQNDDVPAFQKALLHVKPSSQTSAKALFFLGMNALQHEETKAALYFFARSEENATKRDEKDRAFFWSYLVSRDLTYLKNLAESSDINIYTLFFFF